MSCESEQQIRDLCAKVISTQNTDEFAHAAKALKKALHEHFSALRDKVADLALAIAAEDESKAA